MPFIPSGFGQATIEYSIAGPGGPAMVTFGFADNPASTPDTIANTIGVAWNGAGSMRGIVDSGAVNTEIRVLIRRAGNLVAGADFPGVAGGFGGVAASPQVALLFQKLTGFAGRNRRGRMYVPAAPQSTEAGSYIAPFPTTAQNAADTFLANLVAASLPMHLLHVNPVDPPNQVNQLEFVNLVATQRRRLR